MWTTGQHQRINVPKDWTGTKKKSEASLGPVQCVGVHLSQQDDIESHVQVTVKMANRVIAICIRILQTRNDGCLILLWKSLAQPILEYCSRLWPPYKTADMQAYRPWSQYNSPSQGEWEGCKGLDYWNLLLPLRCTRSKGEEYVNTIGLEKVEK